MKLLSNHAPARASLPFRFQAMWLSHPDFSKFISDIWSSSEGHATHKSISIIPSPNHLNKHVFCCLFQKKKRLLARLAGIQQIVISVILRLSLLKSIISFLIRKRCFGCKNLEILG